MGTKDYREILGVYYQQRVENNPRYSQNAFARDLDMTVSHLSSVLKGTKGLSLATATKIAKKLRMSLEERRFFTNLVLMSDARSSYERKKAKTKVSVGNIQHKELSEAMFYVVKDWYHFALLEYLKTSKKNFSIKKASSYFKLNLNSFKML